MTTAAQRKYLNKVTHLLPGYDPWATAEDCTFDYEAAQRACDFFPTCLRHVKGEWAGRPIVLEKWQQGIVANLFGWKTPDGLRRYSQSLIYIPRKNAKTTLAAGIGLYLTFLDDEPGAEVYCAAANEDQAGIVFSDASSMVHACPALARRAQVFGSSILFPDASSKLVVLTGKAATKHGLNPHGIIVDELHTQKDRELVDTLTTAVGSRRQPLTLFLTTADFGRPSICNETHDYACKVRDGVIIDKTFLPIVYEATRDDDWRDEATWKKANPNYGVSVKPKYIRAACKKAQDSPANENTFKRLHLNIVTEQADRWLSLDVWDKCTGETPWKDLFEKMKGRPCYAGLDLSSTRDLTCFCMVFPPLEAKEGEGPSGEPTVMIPVFWVPKDTALAREQRDRVPYPVWSAEGSLRQTEGNVIDYDAVRRDINTLGEAFNIKEIAMDRWASQQISNQLVGDGFELVAFGQGYQSMSAPTKELEKLCLAGMLAHGGQPVLRWCASNVAIETDASANIKPSKKKSSEKIDGIVAGVMAIGSMLARDVDDGPSIYETQGVFVL